MRHLLVRRLLAVEAEREVDMSLGGKRVDASGVRKDMYKVCEGLRKKASRRLEPLLDFLFFFPMGKNVGEESRFLLVYPS